MKAILIAVGSEMLTPFRLDTNSLVVTERLNAIGCEIAAKVVVGDDLRAIVAALGAAAGAVDLVVCTGGLGPTEDDLTRDALAELLGVPLVLDSAILERLQARFRKRGLDMPSINRRQAMVPRGAAVLPNPFGTAPGLWAETAGTAVVLLPGPPPEMTPMLDTVIRERLQGSASGGLIRRVLRITGRTESDVDQVAQPIYCRWTSTAVPIATTILAVMGQIELHLTAAAGRADDAAAALDAAVDELRGVLGPSVYSVDGRSLERVVGDELLAAGLTIAVAESCSGGLLASRLTDVPGSSAYFERGVVCYSNASKVTLLDVPADLIERHGAVSEPVAEAMAAGIRGRAGVSVGVGITGIAGPTGGTEAKPVGTVVVAVAMDGARRVQTYRFVGAREQIKYQATQAALNLVRLLMLERRAEA
jgi:nicotinamide-nucleotide amidase